MFQVCGVVYLSTDICEKLLSFHTMPPLDACTYMGLDSGAPPLEVHTHTHTHKHTHTHTQLVCNLLALSAAV